MKISQLIHNLQAVQETHGDIECQLQDQPPADVMITGYQEFFLVEEQYGDGWILNIRTWPY